jgi:hypothetical protein
MPDLFESASALLDKILVQFFRESRTAGIRKARSVAFSAIRV